MKAQSKIVMLNDVYDDEGNLIWTEGQVFSVGGNLNYYSLYKKNGNVYGISKSEEGIEFEYVKED